MIKVGEYNTLKVIRDAAFGIYLDDGAEGILLPKRFVPDNCAIGDDVNVFIYHDGEDRLIATTQQPKGIAGDIILLRVISTTPQGAFLDNGLMKDLFVPRSKQKNVMRPNGEYLVSIYIDEKSGRMAATEKFDYLINNENLTVKLLQEVDLTVYRKTNIGYVVIINNKHEGVLHFSDVYRNINVGDKFNGFIKKIYENGNIDVAAGKPGIKRAVDESDKILDMLKQHNGYLPYHDKSDADEIYSVFSMSKKTFKMVIGNLYKQRKISLEKTGIKLVE